MVYNFINFSCENLYQIYQNGGFYSNDRMEENALIHAIDMLSTFEEQNKIFPENSCLF